MIFRHRLRLSGPLLAASLMGSLLTAQEPEPPETQPAPPTVEPLPPPPPPWKEPPGRDPDKRYGEGRDRYEWRRSPDSERRGPPGGKSMGGRPPMWGEGFDKLSEDQKRRVRDALGKAWGRPEVCAARDKMMAANEEMRQAINQALKEIDPEIAQILEKMRGPEGHGRRGEPPRLPPVESEEFPDAVIRRLEAELLLFSPPERREAAREMHTRLLAMPTVRAAVEKLNAAPVGERLKAMEELRKLYRETVSEEFGKLRDSQKEPAQPPKPPATEPDVK